MGERALVTGGAGFIGSNLIAYLLRERPDWDVVCFDKLTYAGNLANLRLAEGNPRFTFVRGDVASSDDVHALFAEHSFTFVFHLAAETHVDRSIQDAAPFVRTNLVGTAVLLEAARAAGVARFVHMSTDEVYGSIPAGSDESFDESSPLRPRNPYSATKAGADLLCQSYVTTFEMPVTIARPTNNYGSYQFPEKFLPLMITNLIEGRPIPIYGSGENLRDWLYVEDTCRALLMMAEKAEPGAIYNVAADELIPNIELARRVLSLMGQGPEMLRHVKDRPGHDFCYRLNAQRIREELGFTPSVGLDEGLSRVVAWYRENESWWREIKTGEYVKYFGRQYPEIAGGSQ